MISADFNSDGIDDLLIGAPGYLWHYSILLKLLTFFFLFIVMLFIVIYLFIYLFYLFFI